MLLFQLISGRLPVTGGTAGELLQAHREQRPLRLRDAGRKVHDDLETLVSRLLAKDPVHRPAAGDELAVMMRALAPVAERAPEEELCEAVEDPFGAVELAEAEAEPPQMLPPAVDPGLERAMLGDVGAGPDAAEAVTRSKPFAPRWWRPALTAAGALVAVVVALQLWPAGEAPGPQVAAAAVATPAKTEAVPQPVAVPQAVAVPQPVAVPQAVAEAGPVRGKQASQTVAAPPASQAAATTTQAEPAPANARPSPWAKSLERAQKALWTGHAASAQAILRDVLAKRDLSRRDRARASKLMGDAESKLGNRPRAATWWRKSLQLYEDPQDRARIADLLRRIQ